jgi:quercetin dioxygenase-like cupin family protein
VQINHRRSGTVRGDSHFSGEVWIDHLVRPGEDTTLSVQSVYFSPAARTSWHQHPEGQIIYVVAGSGRIQQRGGSVRTIRAGDTVVTPPGEWHWHGAGAESAMTMIAIQGTDGDGAVVRWGEPVTELGIPGLMDRP